MLSVCLELSGIGDVGLSRGTTLFTSQYNLEEKNHPGYESQLLFAKNFMMTELLHLLFYEMLQFFCGLFDILPCACKYLPLTQFYIIYGYVAIQTEETFRIS